MTSIFKTICRFVGLVPTQEEPILPMYRQQCSPGSPGSPSSINSRSSVEEAFAFPLTKTQTQTQTQTIYLEDGSSFVINVR